MPIPGSHCFYFFIFYGHIHGIWMFPTYAAAVAMLDPLTHWARSGIEPLPPSCCSQSFFFFFFFNDCTCSLWKFRGKGSKWSCNCQPTPQPPQLWIWATSLTYTTACGNARTLTHWAMPGMEPTSSRTACLVLNLLGKRNSLKHFSINKTQGLQSDFCT